MEWMEKRLISDFCLLECLHAHTLVPALLGVEVQVTTLTVSYTLCVAIEVLSGVSPTAYKALQDCLTSAPS